MRPVELEIEGFTAFRDRTVVDFRDADLFALSGPTGAGKSSVIDAITFALYGSVVRYGDRRLVRPLISQGKVETRVRLDFTIADASYRVARVVRETAKGGATTKEARLEHLDAAGEVTENLAGDADSVTSAVAELLGLTFDHFNTCVVLPQGEFARFLHEKPADRQDLLVQLLGLGVYDRMRELANQRARKANVEVDLTDRQLADLADATPDASRDLDRRLGQLKGLVLGIEEAQPTLDRLTATADQERATAAAATEKSGLLANLAVPPDVDEAATKIAKAEVDLDERTTLAKVASLALDEAEAAFDSTVDRSALEAAVHDHEAREKVASRLLVGEAKHVEARTFEGEAREAAAAAAAAFAAADAALEAAKRVDLAQALVVTLEVGAPCPVCHQVVTDVPEHRSIELAEAQATRDRAVAASAESAEAHADKVRAVDKIEVTLTEVRSQLAALDEALTDCPPLATAKTQLDAHVRAERDLANARAADREARDNLAKITAGYERHKERERDLRRRFDTQRDALSALSPPAAGGDRLADDWRDLVGWAGEQRPALDEVVTAAHARATDADKERAELVARIDEYCKNLEIDLAGREPLMVAVEERTRVEGQLEALDEAIARRAKLSAARDESEQSGRVASALANHLKADHFERWILDEAQERLVESATAKLAVLAGGTYSLIVGDGRNFAVVDHANADTVRPARTLSGGETFLVSLALALALADQIAELAAGGAIRLESIFLDEGFGSLDHDTLETVATAIEELGAQGRMVGVVTHVRDLAERLPVRYEVRKGPSTSTVERLAL